MPGDLVFTNKGNHIQIYILSNNQVVNVTGDYSKRTTVQKTSIVTSGVVCTYSSAWLEQ
jgi:hypothetical protein